MERLGQERRTRSPGPAWLLVVFALVIAGACGGDNSVPTGPTAEDALSPSGTPTLTVNSNGGAVPEATVTNEGGLETTVVSFTGAFGNNVQVDGFPWGFDMGDQNNSEFPHGDTSCFVVDAATEILNLPSPTQAAVCATSVHVAFIEFDPPVSSVSFMYTSKDNSGFPVGGEFQDTFPMYAIDINGFAIDVDTLHTSGLTPLSVWDSVGVSASTDRIWYVRIEGNLFIDDLTFTRSLPPILLICDPVERGQPTSCNLSGAAIDSVTEWRFDGGGETIINTDNATTTWDGKAVETGVVSATFFRQGSDIGEVALGDLTVLSRPWRWSQLDPDPSNERIFEENNAFASCFVQAPPPLQWPPLRYDGAAYGENINRITPNNATPCPGEGEVLDPFPLFDTTAVGYSVAGVNDSGPNADFFYVASGSWIIHRASAINPALLDDSVDRVELLTNQDTKACKNAPLPVPGFASWREFNILCKGVTVDGADGFVRGVLDHEGPGDLGENAPQPNGHWVRIDVVAQQAQGDPYFRVEFLTGQDSAAVVNAAQGAAILANDQLWGAADMNHQYVKNNWCGTVYVHDDTANPPQYKKVRLRSNAQPPFMCP